MTTKPRRTSLLVFTFLLAALGPLATAQNVRSLAEREIARRQAGVEQGQAALERGKLALAANDFAKAHDEFRAALTFLPDALTTAGQHDAAVNGFCESGVKLAEQRIAEGKYTEAEQIVREVVNDRYDPNCREALTLLAHLSEPGYFNKTMGPKFIAKVEDVKKLLSDADGYYDSGRYDLAFKKYEQVLNLDPYNVAARRGEERIDNTKTHYGQEAYNETRSRKLWQVQKGWEEPVHQYGQTVNPITDVSAQDVGGTARITNKLNSIIIPRIEFRDASIREAIDFLRQQAAANDPATEGKHGVDIVLRTTALGRAGGPAPAPLPETAPPLPGASPEAAGVEPTPVPLPAAPSIAPSGARITITLNQIPLGEALRYIASQAGLKVKVEPYAVSIVPLSEQTGDLITKRYHVPPEFFGGPLDIGSYLGEGGSAKTQSQKPGDLAAQSLVAKEIVEKKNVSSTSRSPEGSLQTDRSDQNLRQQLVNDRQLVARASAQQLLESMGVDFKPAGSRATFLPQSGVLIVRNTQDNLDMVDALVETANASRPKQVQIEAKFVEITQSNLKELGFDWLLGPFNIAGNSGKIAGSGGTSGSGPGVTDANFPFPTSGLNPVTAGNRSGNLAISGNAIDALLGGAGAGLVAPGIFGLGGIMTNPQFQVVIRALNQKKGIDLLSAPSVTTKSGQRAVMEIVREFRYPTTFTPPQIPTITLPSSGGGVMTTAPTLPVVGPSTPGDFTTRNTGVTLEVEPIVGSDGITIDLNLVPQVVEFEGFINYGSPISTINPGLFGLSSVLQNSIVLTDNVINQPIFSTRKVNTSVSIWDGQTVVLGGLMREDVQKTEDRTPIIGDIPLVGRLFRTNAEQHIKRNLIIFVTARLVDPAGQAINTTEEEEETEVIEPPVLPQVPYYKK